MSSRILGIDLGTVNSCVAVVEDGRARILAEDSRTTIPSCVAFLRGKELVGDAAKRQLVTEPANTVTAVKRILGHGFESREVKAVRDRAPYPIHASPIGGVLVEVGGRKLTPVQISARVLFRVREVAEQALGEPVKRAVISVPAHFNDVQRKATKLAAEYAGLEVLRLINEPTAAAFAYGYRRGENFRLAVYDLGGGTFDITIMSAQGDCFRVDATDGDSFLGGEDFDQAVGDWLAEAFHQDFGHDLREDRTAMLRLKEAAERAKIELSEVEETSLELPFLAQLADGSRPVFTRTLSRRRLKEITQPLTDKTLELCEQCLESANLQRIDIDEVLLVGGQSRMATVREAVREFFGKEPRRDINPDEVVAMGAALYGYSLAASELEQEAEAAAEDAYEVALKDLQVARRLLDSVEKIRAEPSRTTEPSKSPAKDKLENRLEALLEQVERDEVPTPPRSEGASAQQGIAEAVEDLRGELDDLSQRAEGLLGGVGDADSEADTPRTGRDPALNRAVQALTKSLQSAQSASDEAQSHLEHAREHKQVRRVNLIDVTSHALGIAIAGNLFSVLIEKNVPIPIGATRTFTTDQDAQREVTLRVYQGAGQRVSENQFLGEFVLAGIEPAPRLQPSIEVEFSIDADGILSVCARDAVSRRQQEVRFEDPLQLADGGNASDEEFLADEE